MQSSHQRLHLEELRSLAMEFDNGKSGGVRAISVSRRVQAHCCHSSRLLSTVTEHVGETVAASIDSATTDGLTLLIGLTFEDGQITIASVIRGSDSSDEVFNSLVRAREAFDARVESPSPLTRPRSRPMVQPITHIDHTQDFQRLSISTNQELVDNDQNPFYACSQVDAVVRVRGNSSSRESAPGWQYLRRLSEPECPTETPSPSTMIFPRRRHSR